MSYKKTAVILAAGRRNSGMYSVDSAAAAYFKDSGLEYRLFAAQRHSADHGSVAGQTIHFLQSMEELDDYPQIVYWGDFLNNPAYGNGDFCNRDLRYGHSESRAQAIERWARLFTLKGDRKSRRAVSVGNNFQHDFSAKAGTYAPGLRRLEDRFTAILPRDRHSFQNLSRSFSYAGMAKIMPGLDCAFLLPPVRQEKRATFCYFFGRSGFSQPAEMVRMLEAKTGLRGINLVHWLRLDDRRSEAQFQEFRSEIAAAQFVLTDTYHLCINSFTLKTPVIGLGKCAARQTGTLGDFKKRTLFEMIAMEHSYFEQDSTAETETEFYERVLRDCTLDPGSGFFEDARFSLMQALTARFRHRLDRLLLAA